MEVTIYTYSVRDARTGASVIAPRMATEQFIAKVKGAQINEKSAKVVDESFVDDNGQEILDKSKGR